MSEAEILRGLDLMKAAGLEGVEINTDVGQLRHKAGHRPPGRGSRGDATRRAAPVAPTRGTSFEIAEGSFDRLDLARPTASPR